MEIKVTKITKQLAEQIAELRVSVFSKPENGDFLLLKEKEIKWLMNLSDKSILIIASEQEHTIGCLLAEKPTPLSLGETFKKDLTTTIQEKGIKITEVIQLITICVSKEYKAKQVTQKMYSIFQNHAKGKGFKYVIAKSFFDFTKVFPSFKKISGNSETIEHKSKHKKLLRKDLSLFEGLL